jgi:hypothetical protein
MPDDHVVCTQDADDTRGFVRNALAAAFAMPEAAVFGPDLTLAAVLAASPRLSNSVDLMEAFAKAANALRKRSGAVIRLPAFSLDTPVSAVIDSILAQAQAAPAKPR